MRIPAILLVLVVALPAQAPATLSEAMEHLSTATMKLQAVLDAPDGSLVALPDRTAIEAPLQAMEAALPVVLRAAASMPAADNGRAAVAAIERAIADLRAPIGDGLASDVWDLAQLRRACTDCHLQNRTDNVLRGMFPNRGSVVTGSIALFERGDSAGDEGDGTDNGVARDDRRDLVVFLERVGDRATPRVRPAQISQHGRRFDPAVLAVTAGTTVRFPNDDVVFHNVFSLSRGNAFDLGTYGKGKVEERTFQAPGLIKVHCNIHSDMSSHVLVLQSSRHAVTDQNGFWFIPDVPAGTYTLRVWHALAQEQRQQLVVNGEAVLQVPLVVRESKVRAPHPNKHGRAYDKKY